MRSALGAIWSLALILESWKSLLNSPAKSQAMSTSQKSRLGRKPTESALVHIEEFYHFWVRPKITIKKPTCHKGMQFCPRTPYATMQTHAILSHCFTASMQSPFLLVGGKPFGPRVHRELKSTPLFIIKCNMQMSKIFDIPGCCKIIMLNAFLWESNIPVNTSANIRFYWFQASRHA